MQWSLHVLPQVLDARVAGDIYRGPLQGPGTFAGALPAYREHYRIFFASAMTLSQHYLPVP